MEQFDSSVEEGSKDNKNCTSSGSPVSEQQQKNDEQQCPSCAAELTEASVWMIAASETDCMG